MNLFLKNYNLDGKSVCPCSNRLRFNSKSGQTNESGLNPSHVKPVTVKMVFTASLHDAQHVEDSVENKPESLLVVPLGKALTGIPHLRVVDRWPVSPKRGRYSDLIAFA